MNSPNLNITPDRLPTREELGREIVVVDRWRKRLRSLYRLRCQIDTDDGTVGNDSVATTPLPSQGAYRA